MNAPLVSFRFGIAAETRDTRFVGSARDGSREYLCRVNVRPR